MESLIDISDFVGDRSIPNSGNKDVMEKINFFITKYEPQCLLAVLGLDLYNACVAEDPIVDDSRIDRLVNGFESWSGLKSLVVDYVYFYYTKDATIQNTGKNMVLPQVDAGFNITPAQKMIDAWNSFNYGVTNMELFLDDEDNIDIYPEFDIVQAFKLDCFSRTINEFDI